MTKEERAICNAKSYKYQKGLRKKKKLFFVNLLGGQCSICYYKKNLSALQFHHKEPKDKSFDIGRNLWRKGIEELKIEVLKCVLLCANCHAEIHNPNDSI